MSENERTDQKPQADPRFTAPSINLPKGGGAIRGIGEKFAANPVTGTGSMSVPIATSPGRSGFGPQLSLSYDSGAGNGPFGFGWAMSLPAITRKTDKGLPQYRDEENSDVFVLSGAEDLVPVYRSDTDGTWLANHAGYHRDADDWVLDAAGNFLIHDDEFDGFRVRRYRPRIDGLFARIERWTRLDAPADVHWRSISKDNILTLYGSDFESRIADPLDADRIFSWLICETRDDKGNAVLYRYKPDDGAGLDLGTAHERNRGGRDDVRRTANRYLKRIYYGNRTPALESAGNRPRFLDRALIDNQIANADWMFETVFDYGDHDDAAPAPADDLAIEATRARRFPWPPRPDTFSSYRSGFDVRTTRLCKRVLMFHHFPGEADVDRDCLVRSTDFAYSNQADPTDERNPIYTFLNNVTQTGYKRNNIGYDRKSLPPIEFSYTEPIVQDAVEDVDTASLENLPIGVDGSTYRWVDLHGEGIPGILTEQADTWFYKRNISPLPRKLPDHSELVKATFTAVETVPTKPNVALGRGADFMDLAGDGLPDLVTLAGPTPGLYEHDEQEGWQPHRNFKSLPNQNLRDPNLRFIDLDGDGHTDILVAEDDAFVWYPSLTEDGFGPGRRVHHPLDDEQGPRIVFADGAQSVYLADLSGDGLTDIVRVRNGDVCYWPNLGYGNFGSKVAMDDAPWFDNSDQFDHRRLRLADIDGSGTTDLIYLHRDGVRLYFNQSGNRWGQPHQLKVFPQVDDIANIVVTDLLGDGTACLVWSSPLESNGRRPMRYVNLMGRRKPHLLTKTINNLGAETRVDYAPSTKFYLQDKRDGTPWITRLPFPVHVIERVETFDHISRNRFVTRHAYHHGYFDGEEREFRGFGMVEQWDTEQFAALTARGDYRQGDNVSEESHVPPVHTKTWFHTGIDLNRDHISDYFAGLLNITDRGGYFREPGLTDGEARDLLLADVTLPDGLTLEEKREACRSLKGSMLRQEVYADDADQPGATAQQIERARTPYTVTEQNFTIRLQQQRGTNRHAVFFTHPNEAISYHYERNPADPRVQHALTLEVDNFGNVLKQAAVGYGRRKQVRVVDDQGRTELVANAGLAELAVEDQAKQTTTLVTYTENRVTNAIESAESHRTPMPCEALTFELTGYTATGPAGRLQEADLVEPDPNLARRLRHKFTEEVPYEVAATSAPCRRPIEHVRTIYRSDDLSTLLPLGTAQSLGLPGESYKLAFTHGLLAKVFQRPRPDEPPGLVSRVLGRSAAAQPDEPLLPDPAAVLGGQGGDRGGYLVSQALKGDRRFPTTDLDDDWWIPSGRAFFTPNPSDPAPAELATARLHFFLSRSYRNPFGHDAFVDLDAHDLLTLETRDAFDNRVTVDTNDYRVLQPRLVSDPNRNQTEVAFDALGLVVGIAVMGKPLPAVAEGDSLAGFNADLTNAQLSGLFDATNPHVAAPGLLQSATTRTVYDLDRFQRTQQAHPDDPTQWQPACSAMLARETHASAPLPPRGLKLQLSFSYSDGYGREVQKKIQAEPAKVNGVPGPPRWVGSGWTVFNNKGKPVRQYEPFFSATQRFEFGVQVGVSPVLFYDPADRVIATLHPNNTYDKVIFDPWQQTTFDVNDTCAPRNAETGDPRTDAHISGHVVAYLSVLAAGPAAAWQTWYAQRIGGALGKDERNAALRAEAHADTPSTVHLDTLGRPFITLARNRVVCPNHDLDGTEEISATRVELDVEGNQRSVRDERKLPVNYLPTGALEQRIVMRYAYDMLGNRIHQLSMEAGKRWMLNDVAGKPIRTWDTRGHNFITNYDALRRPVQQTVRGTIAQGDSASDPRTLNRDIAVDKIEYGEALANAAALNLRTRVYRHFDSAGVATNAGLGASGQPVEAYDFKGNLLRSTRRLASDYKAVPDWSQPTNPQLDSEFFEGSTRYDALNRAVQSVAPHSSVTRAERPNAINVVQPVFNEANLLERLDVWLELGTEPTALIDSNSAAPSPVGVVNIDYDAKGQRQRIDYKNGASTLYSYDPLAYRLTQLITQRDAAMFPGDDPQPPAAGWPGRYLQDLKYTYDPAGNVTHIRDDAQQTIFFRNKRVEPSNDYVYDALYRLIQATGREHLGQTNGTPNAPTSPGGFNAFHTGLDHPGDGNAMGTYIERYVYDAVGNFLQMQHRGSDPAYAGWTRGYDYLEASLVEDGNLGTPQMTSNRLSRTSLNPNGDRSPLVETYQHDAHGNMVRMPHLSTGQSDRNIHWDYKGQLRRADLGGGGVAHYVYDAAGQRLRKVWQKAPGRTEERVYLGYFEIFRSYQFVVERPNLILERETLRIMSDPDREIALVESRSNDTTGEDKSPRLVVRYQLRNAAGSTHCEVDQYAKILTYEEYSAYGATLFQALSMVETPKRYRFTGKERDEESGFYFHGARYLAPWIAVWISPDPAVGLSCGRSSSNSTAPSTRVDRDECDERSRGKRLHLLMNLYGYARANPIRFADKNGMDPTPAEIEAAAQSVKSATEDLLKVLANSHASTRGTFEAVLAEAQGARFMGPDGQYYSHIDSLRQSTTAIASRRNDLIGALDQIRKMGPTGARALDALSTSLRPVLDKSRDFLQLSAKTEEVLMELRNTGNLSRLEGVALDTGRNTAGLASTQLENMRISLVPNGIREISWVRETIQSIRQLPTTLSGVRDQARQIAATMTASLGAYATAGRAAASRAGSWLVGFFGRAMPLIEAIGTRLMTMPFLIIPLDKNGRPVGMSPEPLEA
jgi:RHS repeat-associated protein